MQPKFNINDYPLCKRFMHKNQWHIVSKDWGKTDQKALLPTLEAQLKAIPKRYSTEKIPLMEKTVYAHYFVGRWDWYILEYEEDIEGNMDYSRFFAYVIGDEKESGYVSFTGLTQGDYPHPELDFYWQPRTLGDILNPQKPEKLAKLDETQALTEAEITDYFVNNLASELSWHEGRAINQIKQYFEDLERYFDSDRIKATNYSFLTSMDEKMAKRIYDVVYKEKQKVYEAAKSQVMPSCPYPIATKIPTSKTFTLAHYHQDGIEPEKPIRVTYYKKIKAWWYSKTVAYADWTSITPMLSDEALKERAGTNLGEGEGIDNYYRALSSHYENKEFYVVYDEDATPSVVEPQNEDAEPIEVPLYKKQGIVSADGKTIAVEVVETVIEIRKEKKKEKQWIKRNNKGEIVKSTIVKPSDTSDWEESAITKTIGHEESRDVPKTHVLTFAKSPKESEVYQVKDEKNKEVGAVVLAQSKDKKSYHVFNVYIDEKYRGMGVANALYDFAEKDLNMVITRDAGLYSGITEAGKRLWKKRIDRKITTPSVSRPKRVVNPNENSNPTLDLANLEFRRYGDGTIYRRVHPYYPQDPTQMIFIDVEKMAIVDASENVVLKFENLTALVAAAKQAIGMLKKEPKYKFNDIVDVKGFEYPFAINKAIDEETDTTFLGRNTHDGIQRQLPISDITGIHNSDNDKNLKEKTIFETPKDKHGFRAFKITVKEKNGIYTYGVSVDMNHDTYSGVHFSASIHYAYGKLYISELEAFKAAIAYLKSYYRNEKQDKIQHMWNRVDAEIAERTLDYYITQLKLELEV
jgi:predicted GNAT family acetyltransferase